MFIMASVTQVHRKRWIVMCVWLLQVNWAIPSTEQGQFLPRSTQALGNTLKPFFKTNFRALTVCTPSAGFCWHTCGYVREEFTLDSVGWLRCCVVSKMGEKFRTTLCNYWQCFVLKSTADIVTLSTLKYAFGLENDVLMQSFVTACKMQVTVYFSQKHMVT